MNVGRAAAAAWCMFGGLTVCEPAHASEPRWTVPVEMALDGHPQTHATRGVVKSINGATMTVSRGRSRGDITFTLPATVHREGTVVVGSTVAVRYRDDGSLHVATAITVQQPGGDR